MLSVLGNDGRLCFMDIAVRKPKITLEISNRDRHITASAIEMHSRYLAACTEYVVTVCMRLQLGC